MTPEDLAILEQQTYSTLARWWCVLNSWQWPSGLPDPESEADRRAAIEAGRFNDRSSRIMNWIQDRVGNRMISLAWNRDSMTLDEHEDFYRATFGRERIAEARYEEFRKRPPQTIKPDAELLVQADMLEDHGMLRGAEILRDHAWRRHVDLE